MKDVFIPIEPEVKDKPAEELLVGGVTRMTTIDFPDCLSAVVFIKGCPWKCVYCQNEDLQSREMNEGDGYVSWEYIDHFLDRRKGLIDGVVFSGGEPCVDPALPDAIKRVKEKGYKIGLHTGGMYPRRLRAILPYLDWVGLDIKAPLSDEAAYEKVVRRKGAAAKVRSSLEMLLEAGVSIEHVRPCIPNITLKSKSFSSPENCLMQELKLTHFKFIASPEDCRRNIFLNVSEVTIRMKRL